MLLEACVCCFVGVDSPAVGSELQSFGAEGTDRSRNPFVEKRFDAGRERVAWCAAEAFHGRSGVVGRFGAEGTARTVALALSEGHRYTSAHRTCKGRRTKERQKVSRVKEGRPCEDTLDARTKRGVTVMPFKSV
jgi:hypothetical protein